MLEVELEPREPRALQQPGQQRHCCSEQVYYFATVAQTPASSDSPMRQSTDCESPPSRYPARGIPAACHSCAQSVNTYPATGIANVLDDNRSRKLLDWTEGGQEPSFLA